MDAIPEFLERFDEFEADRESVASAKDWIAFEKKWFNREDWPEKTDALRAEESRRKVSPIKLGGRTWSFTFWVYDLTPDARYEYFWTLSNVGDPIRFPDSVKEKRTSANGWRQECPYCEIVTDEIGDPFCPRCNRELIYTQIAF